MFKFHGIVKEAISRKYIQRAAKADWIRFRKELLGEHNFSRIGFSSSKAKKMRLDLSKKEQGLIKAKGY
tara:strand:+ start:804 stop:1010 length:207 start_codon:yes stop_codon:yes gene_type:complete